MRAQQIRIVWPCGRVLTSRATEEKVNEKRGGKAILRGADVQLVERVVEAIARVGGWKCCSSRNSALWSRFRRSFLELSIAGRIERIDGCSDAGLVVAD